MNIVLKGGLIKNMRAGKFSNELTDADIYSLVHQLKIPNFKGCVLRDDIPKLKVNQSINNKLKWKFSLDRSYSVR